VQIVEFSKTYIIKYKRGTPVAFSYWSAMGHTCYQSKKKVNPMQGIQQTRWYAVTHGNLVLLAIPYSIDLE